LYFKSPTYKRLEERKKGKEKERGTEGKREEQEGKGQKGEGKGRGQEAKRREARPPVHIFGYATVVR